MATQLVRALAACFEADPLMCVRLDPCLLACCASISLSALPFRLWAVCSRPPRSRSLIVMLLCTRIHIHTHPSDEYDFVPLLDASSSFLVESHKLAISAAAVKPLFREAHAAFQALLQQQGEHHQHQQQAALMLDVTRALLLVNPDVYTAWNARKRLVAVGTIR